MMESPIVSTCRAGWTGDGEVTAVEAADDGAAVPAGPPRDATPMLTSASTDPRATIIPRSPGTQRMGPQLAMD